MVINIYLISGKLVLSIISHLKVYIGILCIHLIGSKDVMFIILGHLLVLLYIRCLLDILSCSIHVARVSTFQVSYQYS